MGEKKPKYNNNYQDELDYVFIVCGIGFLLISIIEITDTKGKSLFEGYIGGGRTGVPGGIFLLIAGVALLYFPIKKRMLVNNDPINLKNKLGNELAEQQTN